MIDPTCEQCQKTTLASSFNPCTKQDGSLNCGCECHGERPVRTENQNALKAWFTFNEHCKKVGIIASAYTAFMTGYSTGHLDAEIGIEEAND